MASVKKKKLEVVDIEMLNNDYFVLWVKDEELAKNIKPGQFCEISPLKGKTTLLKIPISVYDVNLNDVGFMIKVIGNGTRDLSKLIKGDYIECIGPLGNSFDISGMKKILFVTGGIGYAPLNYLRREAFKDEIEICWLHGGRSQDDIFSADYCYTNDGSFGKRGNVSQGLEYLLRKDIFDMIYCCGPEPMMRACVKIAQKYDAKIMVSTEAYMACGIGVCKGCVIGLKEEDGTIYKTVCKDGPIFDGLKVAWHE